MADYDRRGSDRPTTFGDLSREAIFDRVGVPAPSDPDPTNSDGTISGTAASLSSDNPILLTGQLGYTTDQNIIKIGDGETAWNNLKRFGSGFILDENSLETSIGPTSATNELEISALQLDFTSDGVNPIEIGCFIPSITSSAATTVGRISVYIDDVLSSLAQNISYASGSNFIAIPGITLLKVLSAGNHTVEFRVQRQTGTGNITIAGSPNFPAQSWAIQR